MSAFPPELDAYFDAHRNDNQAPNVYATVVTCLVLPYVAVVLRFISRKMMKQPWKADDYLIIAALLTMTSMHISTAIAVPNGFGRHLKWAPHPVTVAKCALAIQTSYSIAVLFTKFSILFFYYRLFPIRSMLILIWIVGTVVFLYSAALVVITMIQCIPMRRIWTPGIDGVCLNIGLAYIVLSVANVVTDIAILVLPVKNVWGLQMNKAKKIQISGIFVLGGIVCIFGIVRSIFVGKADTVNATWTAVQGGIWSQVELSVGIICACLPTYAPLFGKSRRLAGYTANSSYKYGSAHSKDKRTPGPNSQLSTVDRVQLNDLSTSKGSERVWANATAERGRRSSDSDKTPFAVSHGNAVSEEDMTIKVDRRMEHTWSDSKASGPLGTAL